MEKIRDLAALCEECKAVNRRRRDCCVCLAPAINTLFSLSNEWNQREEKFCAQSMQIFSPRCRHLSEVRCHINYKYPTECWEGGAVKVAVPPHVFTGVNIGAGNKQGWTVQVILQSQIWFRSSFLTEGKYLPSRMKETHGHILKSTQRIYGEAKWDIIRLRMSVQL